MQRILLIKISPKVKRNIIWFASHELKVLGFYFISSTVLRMLFDIICPEDGK